MSCEICGKSSCTRSFHSLDDQEEFDSRPETETLREKMRVLAREKQSYEEKALAALRAAVRAADDEIADWRAWSERLGPAVETPMVVDEDDYDTARAAAEPYMKGEET